MEEPSVPCPERWGPWAKDHCNFLLDSIDAQLSQLQARGPKAKMEEGPSQAAVAAAASLVGITCTSGRADAGRCPGHLGGDGSLDGSPPFQKEQSPHCPVHLLAQEGTSRDEKKSDSICTEDFAAAFDECLVDPLLNSSDEREESAFGLAIGFPGHILGSSHGNLTPSQRLLGFQAAQDPRFVGLARDKGAALSPTKALESLPALPEEPPSLCCLPKIHSPESAGEKLSRLGWESSGETSGATKGSWDIPWRERRLRYEPVTWEGKPVDFTWVSRKKGFGCKGAKGPSVWIPYPRDNASSPLLVEDLDPPKPLETVDAAGAKTTLLGDQVPARITGSGGPRKGSNSPRGLAEVACLLALRTSEQSRWVSSSGEGMETLVVPQRPSPLKGCRPGKTPRPASSCLQLNRGISSALQDLGQQLGFPRRGCTGVRIPGGASCAGGEDGALELIGSAGPGTMRAHVPLRDPRRSFLLRDADNEEEATRQPASGSWRSCPFGKVAPRPTADPGGAEASLGDCWSHMELDPDEKKLSQKKAQIYTADGSLHSILQQKKRASLELGTLREAVKESQEEARRLELLMAEDRGKVDEVRADLALLEYKREACRTELVALEKELARQRRCGAAQAKEVWSEKDRELSRMRGIISALEAQHCATERRNSEHQHQLERLQHEASLEKEKELFQLKEELEHEKQQALTQCAELMEQMKARALHQQAAGFRKEMEDLRKIIEERDVELLRQQEATEQQAMELKEKAEKTAQSALLQEKKKWEVDTRVALQVQREFLQEKDRRMQSDLQEALQEERKITLALQDKTAHLQARIHNLETQALLFEGKKREEMEALQAQLQKEKAEALRCLREDLEQEKKQEMDQLRAQLQRVEEDLRLLRAKRSKSADEQVSRHSLATEVALACQQLQDLLPWKAGSVLSTPQMLDGCPVAISSGCALQALQEVCREMQLYLQDLKNKMEVQKNETLQVQREKEHMKDMLVLQQGWRKEDLVVSGRLQEQAGEQQALQRSRGPWEATLALKVAREFEEDLEAELKKCLSRDKPMGLHSTGEEIGWKQGSYLNNSCSRLLNGVALSSPGSFSTPKLLHHLQNRIRELRAEKAGYQGGSLDHLSVFWDTLTQTYRSKRHQAPEVSSSALDGKSTWKQNLCWQG